jgi:hypothetical protein
MSMPNIFDMPYKLELNKEYSVDEMKNLGIFFNREMEDGRLEYTSRKRKYGYHGRLKNGRFKVESRFIDCRPDRKAGS